MYTFFLSFTTGILISCNQSKNDEQKKVAPNNKQKTVVTENLNEEEQVLVKEGFVRVQKGELSLQKNRRYSNGIAPNSISLQNSVLVAKTEVTQKEFQKILNWNPSYFGGCGTPCSTFSSSDEGAEKDEIRFQEAFDIDEDLQSECFDVENLQAKECGPNCPVENVSLYDAIHYTNELSKSDNLPPCFELKNVICTDGRKSDSPSSCMNNKRKGIGSAMISLSSSKIENCTGYRLLTASEWEFIARAGSVQDLPATKNSTGTELRQMGCEVDSALDKLAVYGGNSRGMPQDVATKEPNVFGLYDTVGNVWEWVYDSMEHEFRNPTSSEQGNAKRSSQSGKVEFKIMGGSWLEFASYCRIGEYSSMSPGDRDPSTGFRVAITIPRKPRN